jgi:hypothetical protein
MNHKGYSMNCKKCLLMVCMCGLAFEILDGECKPHAPETMDVAKTDGNTPAMATSTPTTKVTLSMPMGIEFV